MSVFEILFQSYRVRDLAPSVSYWVYFKEAAFGIFRQSAIDGIMLVILQSINPFMGQHIGSQTKFMAVAVDIMCSVSFSDYMAGRWERVHFPCSILHHLEMLSSLLLGFLVRRLFLLCILRLSTLFCPTFPEE